MKSIHDGKSYLLRTQTTSQNSSRYRCSDDPKESAMTAAALLATVVAILALCAVMFVALYRWSRYAPILPSDGAAVPAIKDTTHSSRWTG
jgi:hypothetical protein